MSRGPISRRRLPQRTGRSLRLVVSGAAMAVAVLMVSVWGVTQAAYGGTLDHLRARIGAALGGLAAIPIFLFAGSRFLHAWLYEEEVRRGIRPLALSVGPSRFSRIPLLIWVCPECRRRMHPTLAEREYRTCGCGAKISARSINVASRLRKILIFGGSSIFAAWLCGVALAGAHVPDRLAFVAAGAVAVVVCVILARRYDVS